MKDAYLLDEDVLLKGYIYRKFLSFYFIPNNKFRGFDKQKIWKQDIGRILFYSLNDVESAGLGSLKVIG